MDPQRMIMNKETFRSLILGNRNRIDDWKGHRVALKVYFLNIQVEKRSNKQSRHTYSLGITVHCPDRASEDQGRKHYYSIRTSLNARKN